MERKRASNIQLEWADKIGSWVYFCLDCNIMITVDSDKIKGIKKHDKLYCHLHHEVHYGKRLE
jgi:hypothetical protein